MIGFCGSCWAFSAGLVIDNCITKKTKIETKISKQQILDCSAVDYGCFGGWPADTLRYFSSKNFTFFLNNDYPYLGRDDVCRTLTNKPTYKFLTTYPENEALKSESDLISLVANYGFVSVAVSASTNFQSYSGGIFDDPSCNAKGCYDVDHAVTIVGYNLTAPVPYW